MYGNQVVWKKTDAMYNKEDNHYYIPLHSTNSAPIPFQAILLYAIPLLVRRSLCAYMMKAGPSLSDASIILWDRPGRSLAPSSYYPLCHDICGINIGY